MINAIETVAAEGDLVVFPNPAQKEVSISGFVSTGKGTIKWINAEG